MTVLVSVQQRDGVLDGTIDRIFGASLTVGAVLGRERLSDEAAARLHGVIDDLDRIAAELRVGIVSFRALTAEASNEDQRP